MIYFTASCYSAGPSLMWLGYIVHLGRLSSRSRVALSYANLLRAVLHTIAAFSQIRNIQDEKWHGIEAVNLQDCWYLDLDIEHQVRFFR